MRSCRALEISPFSMHSRALLTSRGRASGEEGEGASGEGEEGGGEKDIDLAASQ